MGKREIRAALKAAGGTRQLAILLGVTQRTVQRWSKTGKLPTRGKAPRAFLEYEAERKRAVRIAREERQIFDALLKEAGELQRLPKSRSGTRHRDGARTFGTTYTLALNRMVSPALPRRVEAWATSVPSRPDLNVWQGKVMSTQYALPGASNVVDFRGYQSARSVEQMSSPRSGDFGVGILQATVRAANKTAAVKLLIQRLHELQNARELLVFIHHVELYQYKWRTEQERKTWETQKRNMRRKKTSTRMKPKPSKRSGSRQKNSAKPSPRKKSSARRNL